MALEIILISSFVRSCENYDHFHFRGFFRGVEITKVLVRRKESVSLRKGDICHIRLVNYYQEKSFLVANYGEVGLLY